MQFDFEPVWREGTWTVPPEPGTPSYLAFVYDVAAMLGDDFPRLFATAAVGVAVGVLWWGSWFLLRKFGKF